jgi:hypothetical protein
MNGWHFRWKTHVILACASAGLHLVSAGIAADCQAPNRLLPRLPLLTTMRQVHLLTFEQASRAYPVRLRGVVTFYDPYQQGNPALFIADATGTIFVKLPHGGILSLQMG